MKRLAISVALLAVMTAGCFYSVYAVDKKTDALSEKISEVEGAFASGDTQGCTAAAEELREMWNDFVGYGILVNDLGHAVEITSSVAEISSFARESNEELYAACDRAQAQIRLFRDMQTPTIWKVL